MEILYIDNSTLEKIECDRKLHLYLDRRLEAARPKHACNFGTAMHAAWAARDRHPEPNNLDLVAPAMKVAFREAFPQEDIPFDEYRTISYGEHCIDLYLKKYPVVEYEPLTLPDGRKTIELNATLPLGQVTVNGVTYGVVWVTIIDFIARHKKLGGIYLIDRKTTSRMDATFYDQFTIGSQMTGYMAQIEFLCKERPAGVAIDTLVTRKIPETSKGKGPECIFQPIPILWDHVEEWKIDTLHHIERHLHNRARKYFPKQTKACVGKYGKCEYFDVCSLPPTQREQMLNTALYRPVQWNPMAERR